MNLPKPANRKEILNRIEHLQDKSLSILQSRQKILRAQAEVPFISEAWRDLELEYLEWGKNLEDITDELEALKERLA